jgi:hypothetical protein
VSAKLLKAGIFPVLSSRGPEKGILADAVSSSLQTIVLAPTRIPIGKSKRKLPTDFPSTEQLLTGGGDARIDCGPNGCNQYGCTALPDPKVLAYGSSTASTISPAGFAAADVVRKRLKRAASNETPHATYERELERLRHELTGLCGLDDVEGLEIIFGASGTDLHLFASQLIVDTSAPRPLIVRVEAAETGRGVPDALAGRHFSGCAALGDAVVANAPIDCGRPLDILEVKCRTAEGKQRSVTAIDREVEEAVIRGVATDRRVLLTLVDVSKTGLLAPSPACVNSLRQRYPNSIEVLVDACQFRLAPSTVKSYLQHDFMVAITGSKFITGPTFCGALLVPSNAAKKLRNRKLPRAMKAYSAKADWPHHWAARAALNPVANYGLLLRWEAALTELRAFRSLPEEEITNFLETFTKAVANHLSTHAGFEILPVPALDRGPISSNNHWDRLPTIFSFLLTKPSASGQPTYLTQAETKKVHELLRASHCQLGQPVACGTRAGIPVSALRLCVSSRLIVDALSPEGRGTLEVISEALAVLNQAALLASLPLI